ncbi:hypothetical protein EA796_06700 [Pseudomonas sp. AOB-7]|nr:hypothetical protein EA796_06700 [Pseudomonas sp. AOB-7]
MQAVGSVAAIFAAIGIAEAARREQKRQKELDAAQVNLAHEKRLWCLLWECNYLATQLKDQLEADKSIMPGKETKDLLSRCLDRAVRNFDDDLDVWRLDTASDCRYMLGVYIHVCERRMQKLDAEDDFVRLTNEFQAGLSSRLAESSARFNAQESVDR